MSKHWHPDETVAPPVAAGGLRMPKGARTGLVVVAALSVGAVILLYRVLGPRQVVAPGAEKHLGGAQGGKRN